MVPYNTPQTIRPLEKTICDFAYSNGYDPISVFNDFLRYVIHGFSPGAPPLMDWKYKRQQNRHFMEMLTGWIRLMQRELQSGGWFDAFGDLFMAISSKSERTVLHSAGYLRPDGLMYRFGGDSDRETYL